MAKYSFAEHNMRSNGVCAHYKAYNGKLYINAPCYSGLNICIREGEEATIYLPFPDYADIPYINWMLNTDLFGSRFITKDAEDGIYNGFKYQSSGDYYEDIFQLIALRFPFEFNLFQTWSAFRAEGYDEMESLWLMCRFAVNPETRNVSFWHGNSNHFLLQRSVPYKAFNEKNHNPFCGSVAYNYSYGKDRFPHENGDNPITCGIEGQMTMKTAKKKIDAVLRKEHA